MEQINGPFESLRYYLVGVNSDLVAISEMSDMCIEYFGGYQAEGGAEIKAIIRGVKVTRNEKKITEITEKEVEEIFKDM